MKTSQEHVAATVTEQNVSRMLLSGGFADYISQWSFHAGTKHFYHFTAHMTEINILTTSGQCMTRKSFLFFSSSSSSFYFLQYTK